MALIGPILYWDSRMRSARAAISCLLSALALSGCMGRTTPVGVAYAEAAPAGYDSAYRLDAGDRLVYGQEGLTNTYAIDAGGAITMPLIGAVPARGRTPAGVGAKNSPQRGNGP